MVLNMDFDIKEYKGFDIIERKDVPDCYSKGIHLRHKKTGLEVVHLYNKDDKENLCAFCFRTVPENSTGVPHIIEHSVLCGSEKYPVKDPFIHLENQSVKTYLNALTGCDRTLYPVSSVIEEDYFNLFSVYADSVFFPLLRKEAFWQEGHHLEKDDKGDYSIQGVVYNEMKGCYSSFYQVASDYIHEGLLNGSIYTNDHGGNPLNISDLSYEQYLAFYKEHYRPDNCLLFLYGDIPTEKQLDFIQENFLNRIEQRMEKDKNYYPSVEFTPLQKIKNTKCNPIVNPLRVEKKAPSINSSNSDEDPSVIVAWNFGEYKDSYDLFIIPILCEILAYHDASPLAKKLLDSGLGRELSNLCGFDASSKYSTAAFGLDGVKKEDVDKVYDLIISEVQNIVDGQINQDDLDCALMDYNFSIKEIERIGGPFSISYLKKVVRAWTLGQNPFSYLFVNNLSDKILHNIKENPRYIQDMLKKYFLDNKQRGHFIITPSPDYAKEFQIKEEQKINQIKSQISDDLLKEETEKLRLFQLEDETDKLKCLPHIDAKTIKYEVPLIKPDFSLLEYDKDRSVPFVYSNENTNGIDYIKIAFPFDTLNVEDYPFIPFLSYVLTEIGWNNKKWDECSTIVNKYSGGFGASQLLGTSSKAPHSNIIKEMIEPYNLYDRDYFSVSAKMLHENIKPCAEFIYECISSPDFKDLKRIENLFNEYLADFESSISRYGHNFMSSRTSKTINRVKAIEELFTGISGYFILKEYKNKIKFIANKLEKISKQIFSSGAIIHLICDSNSKDECFEQVKVLSSKLNLKMPIKKSDNSVDEKIYKMVKLFDDDSFEFFSKDVQVGFAACSTKCSSYGTRELVAEMVFSHWFSNSLLWEKIRTVCGAYGANASAESVDECFSIITYRDPNPMKSLSVIEECLKTASEKEFSEDEVNKAVTGCFGSELNPRTPKLNGIIGFNRILGCIHHEDVLFRVKTILTITPEDLHQAACRLIRNFGDYSKKAILNPKNNKITSKFEKLEL